MVWPTARVRLTAMSKSMTPASTSRSSVETASASAWVKARSLPRSGKPKARHRRRAWSMVAPVSSATSRALKTISSPRIACSRSEGSTGGRPAAAASTSAGSDSSGVVGPPRVAVDPAEEVHQLVLHVLDVGDVVQLDRAVGAGVADDEGAAPEQPVDRAHVVGHVADPQERDVVSAPGDQALARDQALRGDRV